MEVQPSDTDRSHRLGPKPNSEKAKPTSGTRFQSKEKDRGIYTKDAHSGKSNGQERETGWPAHKLKPMTWYQQTGSRRSVKFGSLDYVSLCLLFVGFNLDVVTLVLALFVNTGHWIEFLIFCLSISKLLAVIRGTPGRCSSKSSAGGHKTTVITDTKIKHNARNAFDNTDLAISFNNHFISIGENLSNTISHQRLPLSDIIFKAIIWIHSFWRWLIEMKSLKS